MTKEFTVTIHARMSHDGSLTATLWADWWSKGEWSRGEEPVKLSAPFARHMPYDWLRAVVEDGDHDEAVTLNMGVEFQKAVMEAEYVGSYDLPPEIVDRVKELMVMTDSAITIMHKSTKGVWTP